MVLGRMPLWLASLSPMRILCKGSTPQRRLLRPLDPFCLRSMEFKTQFKWVWWWICKWCNRWWLWITTSLKHWAKEILRPRISHPCLSFLCFHLSWTLMVPLQAVQLACSDSNRSSTSSSNNCNQLRNSRTNLKVFWDRQAPSARTREGSSSLTSTRLSLTCSSQALSINLWIHICPQATNNHYWWIPEKAQPHGER